MRIIWVWPNQDHIKQNNYKQSRLSKKERQYVLDMIYQFHAGYPITFLKVIQFFIIIIKKGRLSYMC